MNIKPFMPGEQLINMEKPNVYLAGTIYSEENPFKWHNNVKRFSSEVSWINPFEIHPAGTEGGEIYDNDLEAVSESDAVLLRRSDYEVCGAYIESGFAHALNIPTVVFDDASDECPKFLEWHADSVHESNEEAVTRILEIVLK